MKIQAFCIVTLGILAHSMSNAMEKEKHTVAQKSAPELPLSLEKNALYERFKALVCPVVAHEAFNKAKRIHSITSDFSTAIIQAEDGTFSLTHLKDGSSKTIPHPLPWLLSGALSKDTSRLVTVSRPHQPKVCNKTLTLLNTQSMQGQSLGKFAEVGKLFIGNNYRLIISDENATRLSVSSDIRKDGTLSWHHFPAVRYVTPAMSEHGDFVLTAIQDDPQAVRYVKITSDAIIQIATATLAEEIEQMQLSNCGKYALINETKLYDLRAGSFNAVDMPLSMFTELIQSSNNGDYVLVNGLDGCKLIDMSNPSKPKIKIEASYRQNNLSAINDSGTFLIVINHTAKQTTLYDLATMKSYPLVQEKTVAAGISNNGQYAVTIGHTAMIVWDLRELPRITHFKIDRLDAGTKFAHISDDGRFVRLTQSTSQELIDIMPPLPIKQEAFLMRCIYLQQAEKDCSLILRDKSYKKTFKTFTEQQQAHLKSYFKITEKQSKKLRWELL